MASLNAAPVLTTGTPANSYLSTPTAAKPSVGTLFNFDSLTPGSTFSSFTYATKGVTISSPDGLLVEPFSTETAPNELFDNSANGSANISIKTFGTNGIGIGIADSDPVTITLQALNANGVGFGSLFSVTLSGNTANPYNGYFVISDTSADIYGLQILQSTGNANYSGLAIDDLQVAPEPSTLALLSGGLLLGISRLRKRS